MTSSRVDTRLCPRCGYDVARGKLHCSECAYEFDDVWYQLVRKSQTRYRRWRIWFEAQVRRGKRRQEELVTSPRYHNALVKLRLKYNMPSDGFSTPEEAKSWSLWFRQGIDQDAQTHKRCDRRIGNRLRRDCERLAKKFRVAGDWTIVRRHALYPSAITDFGFDEGWSIDCVEDTPKLVTRSDATQETVRSGKRLLRRVSRPPSRQPLSHKP